jgi:hypothetical protein
MSEFSDAKAYVTAHARTRGHRPGPMALGTMRHRARSRIDMRGLRWSTSSVLGPRGFDVACRRRSHRLQVQRIRLVTFTAAGMVRRHKNRKKPNDRPGFVHGAMLMRAFL